MNIVLVKNMLCQRCVVSVEDILNKAAVPFHKVIFGEIHLTNEISREQKGNLVRNLKNEGFELIESHMSELIEKIKTLVIKKHEMRLINKVLFGENKTTRI